MSDPMGAPRLDENDPQFLKQKLKMVTEWHERAEAQLAKIQRLPDHSRSLRYLVENPAVAMPLLQNYDDLLLAKKAEIDRLNQENSQLKKQLESRTDDDKEAISTAKMSEERAQLLAEEAKYKLTTVAGENSHLKAHINELDAELQSLKDKIHQTLLSEGRLKDQLNFLTKQRDEAENCSRVAVEQMQQAKQESQAAKRESSVVRNEREEEQHAIESQKVQLHLMGKENDDKVQEIERLRTKMITALQKANENHETHCKILEQKHRTVIENLHEQIRAQEAAMLKLRAQLARVEVNASGSGTVALAPTAVIDLHNRTAQEAELKRLYAENTSLQLQRDDATFRLEQSQSEKRTELDSTVRELRRDLETARARARDSEDKLRRAENDLVNTREHLRRSQQEQQSALRDAVEAQGKTNDQESKVKEYLRTISSLTQSQEDSAREYREVLEAARSTQKNLDRRVDDLKKELHDEKEKSRLAKQEQQRLVDEERNAVREGSSKLAGLERSLHDKDLEVQSLTTKAERLTQGLNSHKQQIAVLDERLNGMVLGEQQYRKDIRTLTLQVEQLRMDHTRVSRERDRLAQDMNMLGNIQKRLQTA